MPLAAAASPRDYRWPMVLARLQTYNENYDAAIAAYRTANDLRPDRVDLLIARGTLEERLLRFDDATATYTKVYELAYRDPRWMERVALLHARNGKKDQAVAALRKALVEGRPETPATYQRYAQALEAWSYLSEAREAAEKSVELAGDDLLTEHASVATTYANVMTRLRQHEAAFARLAALPNPDKGGRLENVLSSMGATAGRYFTPEEKLALAQFLAQFMDKQRLDQRMIVEDSFPILNAKRHKIRSPATITLRLQPIAFPPKFSH